MSYPPIEKQIEEFGLYIPFCGKLKRYYGEEFFGYDKHHYILEQEYFRYPERYEGEQKIILLPHDLHMDLHSAMSDARFFKNHHIERDVLLYRKHKVDIGFWDSNNEYKEDIQIIDEREI